MNEFEGGSTDIVDCLVKRMVSAARRIWVALERTRQILNVEAAVIRCLYALQSNICVLILI